MAEETFGTIAALEFRVPPTQSFEDIVEELDISFRPFGLTRRSLIWDSDDIAILERDSLRVLMGWLPAALEGGSSFLVFAVGHATSGGNLLVNRETCEFVKDILVTHMDSYLNFETVFHADATQPVGTELVDTVTEILNRDFSTPHDGAPRTPSERGFKRDRAYTRDITLDPDFIRAHTPQFEGHEPEVVNVEGEILPPQDATSLPKRLTIYTLGATMLLYTPPVGASLLIYSTLRDLVPTHAHS